MATGRRGGRRPAAGTLCGAIGQCACGRPAWRDRSDYRPHSSRRPRAQHRPGPGAYRTGVAPAASPRCWCSLTTFRLLREQTACATHDAANNGPRDLTLGKRARSKRESSALPPVRVHMRASAWPHLCWRQRRRRRRRHECVASVQFAQTSPRTVCSLRNSCAGLALAPGPGALFARRRQNRASF